MLQHDVNRIYESIGKRVKTALFWKIVIAISVIGMIMIAGVHTTAVERSESVRKDSAAAAKRALDNSFSVAQTLSEHQARRAHPGASEAIAVLREQLNDVDDDIEDIKEGQNVLRDQQLETLRALDRLTTELKLRRGALDPGTIRERASRGGWPPPPDGG